MERYVDEVDVAIVGGGPAGLSAAIRLVQNAEREGAEIRVCVIEKGAELGECDRVFSRNFQQPIWIYRMRRCLGLVVHARWSRDCAQCKAHSSALHKLTDTPELKSCGIYGSSTAASILGNNKTVLAQRHVLKACP